MWNQNSHLRSDWMNWEKLIGELDKGDLIEFYGMFGSGTLDEMQQWALFAGCDGCISCLGTGECTRCAYIFHYSVTNNQAVVKRELLADFANRSECRKNNSLDQRYTPYSTTVIMDCARAKLGKVTEYSFTDNNSEHFVNDCRYGVRFSEVRCENWRSLYSSSQRKGEGKYIRSLWWTCEELIHEVNPGDLIQFVHIPKNLDEVPPGRCVFEWAVFDGFDGCNSSDECKSSGGCIRCAYVIRSYQIFDVLCPERALLTDVAIDNKCRKNIINDKRYTPDSPKVILERARAEFENDEFNDKQFANYCRYGKWITDQQRTGKNETNHSEWRSCDEILDEINTGDKIQFDRSCRDHNYRQITHWAVFAGYDRCDSSLECARLGGCSLCAYVIHYSVHDAKRELLRNVAEGKRCRKDNSLDERYTASSSETILKRARAKLGKYIPCYNSPFSYRINCCEDFANYCRYGGRFASQIMEY